MKIKIIITAIALSLLSSCSKNDQELLPSCEAITYMIDGDTSIHWHRVCGDDLSRFRSYPRYSYVAYPCDLRIQELIIGPDGCKK